MPERMWQWQRRIRTGSDRLAPLDFGSELWNWDVNAYESANGVRLSKARSGRPFDDDDVLADATLTLLQDVVDAAGGLEAAYRRFVASFATARSSYERFAAKTGYGRDEAEPQFGQWFSDPSLEDAWYALEEMITWARTLDERLRHEAHDKRRYPDQGLVPALADGPRRDAVIAARSRLITAHLKEVRYLAGLNRWRPVVGVNDD